MKRIIYFALGACFLVWHPGRLLAQSTNKSQAVATAVVPGGSDQPTVALRTDLISASPNAESLGRFGVIPVSYATGVPDISIPLGEVKGRELSVPITLNYHHTGMKPYEIAGWVGLGWSLNAGGVITRVIRDKVDELTAEPFKYDTTLGTFNLQNVDQDLLDGAAFKGLYDVEPDVFVFNFGNYSGKFIISKGQFYQFPYQKLKISGNTGGFAITTPEGITYTFDETERTNPKTVQVSAYVVPQYTSSWFLSKITSADGKENIRFYYSAGTDPVPTHSAASQTYQKYVGGGQGENSILFDKQVPAPSFVYTKRLESIVSSKMEVNFVPQATLRTDIANTEYALDRVIIHGTGSASRSFKFLYSYFGNTPGIYSTLKLNGLEEGGADGVVPKKHSFIYNEGAWPAQTDDVDHWGYANGVNSGPIIIPNTIYDYGMDRSPKFNFTSLGMLKQIIYPTGGSTAFTYEPNVADVYPRQFQRTPMNLSDYLNRSNPTGNDLLTKKTSFTLSTDQTVQITYSRIPKQAVGSTSPNGPDDPAKDVEPEISISAPIFSRVAASGEAGGSTNSTAAMPTFLIYYNRDNGGVTSPVFLSAGDYEITLKVDSKELGTAYSINYISQSNSPMEGIPAPGLRIKEVSDYPTASITGTPLLKKTYSYVDSLGFSTGVLSRGVDYGGREMSVFKELTTTRYQLYQSSINSSLGDLIEQDMYYRKVNEYQVAGTDALRSQYEFSSFDGGKTNVNGQGTFMTKKTDYKKKDGVFMPLVSTDYNYKMAATGEPNFSALRPYMTVQKIPTASYPIAGPLREWGYDFYSLNPGVWRYLASESQTYYNDLGTISSATEYVNDIKKNFQLSAVKKKDSDGKEKIIKYKYAENYDPSLMQGLIAAHVLSPVIEQQVWSKRSATDSVLIGGKIDEYDQSLLQAKATYLLESAVPVFQPDQESVNATGQYSSLLSDSRYKKRIQYEYDSATGNLITQDMAGSETVRQVQYIWGYHNGSQQNLYPIAECRNGSLADFFYTGFEDGGQNVAVLGNAHTGTSFYQGNYTLGFAVPDPAKAYMYSYWYLSGGKWQYSGELSYTAPVVLNGEAIDDVRVYPKDGQMATYTYHTLFGLSSMTDQKGMTTYYGYDSFGHLMDLMDQGQNIIKHTEYHYKN
jgi:hypothetical protein